jgi:hypothetical protein
MCPPKEKKQIEVEHEKKKRAQNKEAIGYNLP